MINSRTVELELTIFIDADGCKRRNSEFTAASCKCTGIRTFLQLFDQSCWSGYSYLIKNNCTRCTRCYSCLIRDSNLYHADNLNFAGVATPLQLYYYSYYHNCNKPKQSQHDMCRPSEWRNSRESQRRFQLRARRVGEQKYSQKGGATFIKITAKLLPRCSLNKCFFSHCVAATTTRIMRKGEKLGGEIKRNNCGYRDEWQKRRQIFQRWEVTLRLEGIFCR